MIENGGCYGVRIIIRGVSRKPTPSGGIYASTSGQAHTWFPHKIVERKNPNAAKGMEAGIYANADPGFMDAIAGKRGMEEEINSTADAGSMASFKKAKTGMEGGSNTITDSGSLDARTPNRGSVVTVKPHSIEGVFIAKGKEDVLCTKNIVAGEAVYNDKIISLQNEDGTKVEYRSWNPFLSMLAASIVYDVEDIYIKPGARVLYLGAGIGTTVFHVSNIVGADGVVYVVESSPGKGTELVKMVKKRANVIPILEDARHPVLYRKRVGEVDVICSEIVKPDRIRILALNAAYFLKDGGHFVMSSKVSSSRETLEEVFNDEDKELRSEGFFSYTDVALTPFEPSNGCTFGRYGPQFETCKIYSRTLWRC